MLILKYLLTSFIFYLVILFSATYLYFDKLTNNIINQEITKRDLAFDNFKTKVNNTILNNQYEETTLLLNNLVESYNYKYINIKYTDYYLTKKSIVIHSDKNIDMSWQLNDITMDASQGMVTPLSNTISLIKPAELFDIDENDIYIKVQAENQDKLLNIISTISYRVPSYQNNKNTQNDFFINKLKYFINLKDEPNLISLYIKNIEFAQIIYQNDNEYIYSIIKSRIYEFVLYYTLLFITIVFFFLVFNYIIMQNTTNKYLLKLKEYTSDILENNFYRFDTKQLVYNNIKAVAEDITKISKKMATIINELNVNRNQLELKVSSDELTGLHNNKIFESEIKNLFLSKTPAYIVKIKLLCISQFSSTHTINETNNLILSFVNNINNIISKDSRNISLFRIYGSEFTMIVKHKEFEQMNKLLNDLSNSIVTLKDEYKINTKIAHLCSLPFDYYSSTKEILDRLNMQFNKTVNIPKQISFYNEDNKKLNNENNKLLKIVSSIIKNSAFTLAYKYDTYRYSDDKLIMKEVSPNLINFDGSIIPIGTFVSVASEIHEAINFDKDVVEKTFKYIKNSNIDYKLAVNLSIDSIKDDGFITWIESKLLYDYEDIKDKIVFSITSFAAKNNFEEFLEFTYTIKRFGGSVILKRFNFNDLSFDQLEKVNIHCIRVHSDYTDVLDNQKRNILRNISDFCITNNIKLYADMVNSSYTHEILKNMNFDGASKVREK